MRKIVKTQTDTGAWAIDSAGINIDLERTGLLTRIDATVEITPSATLTGANQADGLWRVIQNLRVEGGSHTYFALPADDACMGGTLLHYLNRKDFRMTGHPSGSVTAPQGRTFIPVTFTLHCGSRPQDPWGRDNPFDLTGFIPAHAESQLKAVWITSGNDVMDDAVTLSSATMRLTLSVVQGTEAELAAEMVRQGVGMAMVPAWSTRVFAHTATSSDYSEELDIPTGAYLARIAIAEQDATGDRSLRAADEVTGIAVKLPLQNEEVVRRVVEGLTAHLDLGTNLTANDAAEQFQGHSPVGIYIVDLRQQGHPDYGLNLIGMQTGAVKLGFTISVYASGDDSLILYQRYLPYRGKLAAV